MDIKSIDDYGIALYTNKNYFRRIEFTTKSMNDFLNNATGINEQELCTLINMINNQNISDINILSRTYKHCDTLLNLESLSKGERVIFVAYLADKSKQPVYIHTDMTQLSKNTLRLFMKNFYKSDYVNIVCEPYDDGSVYKRAIKEIANGTNNSR